MSSQKRTKGSTEHSSSSKRRRLDDAESKDSARRLRVSLSSESDCVAKPTVPTPEAPEPSSSSKRRRLEDAESKDSAKVWSLLLPNYYIQVGYYNANFIQGPMAGVAKPGQANSKAIDKWIKACKHDIGNAIREDDLHFVCLVGIGAYKRGLGKLYPDWLQHHHDDKAMACCITSCRTVQAIGVSIVPEATAFSSRRAT